MEQLIIAQQELKSAEAIISILKEEGKYSQGSMVPKIPMPVDVSNHKPTSNNGRWVKVEHKMRKPKCTTYDNSFQHSTGKLISSRFSPPETLKEYHDEEENYDITNREHFTSDFSQGSEIPTIVNGLISVKNTVVKNNLKKRTLKFSHSHKSINSETRVKVCILGDSHLREMSTKLMQNLSHHYRVSSIIKPGAKTKQIVAMQD